MAAEKFDILQVITDKIVALMERGGLEWKKGWSGAASSGLPRNGTTGEAYKGANVLLLWVAAAEAGYTKNVWMTFKQAQSLGACVRKGEKGTMCCYFEMVPKKGGKDAQAEGDEPGFFPMAKAFWLFNVAQIDGLPADLLGTAEQVRPEFDPVEAAEQVLQASGAVIRHGFDGAFYQPGRDEICMPERARFHSAAEYYATGVHELTHWTGHESRLNRTFGKRFGDDAYAFEELVAELGAAYTMGALGLVDTVIEGHAAYLNHWLKVLKSDKSAIFTAAKQAGLAHEFIMNKAEQARQAQAQ